MHNSDSPEERTPISPQSSPFGLTRFEKLAEEMHVGEILMRRWFAGWIDLIALGAIVLLPSLAIESAKLGENISTAAFYVGIIIVIVYFPLCEYLWGRSLGKVVTGLIVVNENGRTPRLWCAIIRNLLRLVEDNPLFLGGVPAAICVLSTKRKQRLGDLVARTYVLRAVLVRQMLEHDAFVAPAVAQIPVSTDEEG